MSAETDGSGLARGSVAYWHVGCGTYIVVAYGMHASLQPYKGEAYLLKEQDDQMSCHSAAPSRLVTRIALFRRNMELTSSAIHKSAKQWAPRSATKYELAPHYRTAR